MKIKKRISIIALFGITAILQTCTDNPIWNRFIKNPNVVLEALQDFPYVNFKNEISYGHTFSQPSGDGTRQRFCIPIGGGEGGYVKSQYSEVWTFTSGSIRAYKEKRIYPNDHTYEIRVTDIETAWVSGEFGDYVGVTSYKANVDGVDYSGLDKRYQRYQ